MKPNSYIEWSNQFWAENPELFDKYIDLTRNEVDEAIEKSKASMDDFVHPSEKSINFAKQIVKNFSYLEENPNVVMAVFCVPELDIVFYNKSTKHRLSVDISPSGELCSVYLTAPNATVQEISEETKIENIKPFLVWLDDQILN